MQVKRRRENDMVSKRANRIQISNTELSVYPIGLGTVNAGIDWDGEKARLEQVVMGFFYHQDFACAVVRFIKTRAYY